MLRDRYDPMNLFDLVPALGMELDPVLTRLDRLLDDDTLFQAVKTDLAKRHPRALIDGRPSTPVEVILRLLIIKHLYQWSYEHTDQWVGDSLVLRQFCRVYTEVVPDDTTLIRWANLIQPATLHHLLDHVVDLARQLKVTRGRKLRIDGTVVESNIHHPTDSSLLYDGVRVLSRTLRKAKQMLLDASEQVRDACRSRTPSAKRAMMRIMQTARRRGEQAEQALQLAYQHLLSVSGASVQQEQHPGVIAEHFEQVTVLFADILNFTPLSARITPAEVVALLNEVFSLFDQLAERRGLEKIKTIGDAYMVASGLPTARSDHAHAAAAMALDMLAALKRFNDGRSVPLQIRIGLNSGPVVARVVGTKKFIYDLWGDTVNTASRMESHSEADTIQITRTTYELVCDAFVCVPRGTIPVKGKGQMNVWHIVGQQ